MSKPVQELRILHILIAITETSAAYNEHCLSLIGKRDITLCTYFRSEITPPKEISLFEGDDTLIGFFRALKCALNEKEYDVVHAHSPHVGFIFLIANMVFGKFIGSTVFTVHSSYRKLNYKFRNRLMLIPNFAFFQRVVCCSKASFESFPWLFKWIAGDRICTVQNGINIDRVEKFLGNKPKYPRDSTISILTVGRLIDIKNPINVLNAFQLSANEDSRLIFIGEGPMRDLLMTISRESGLEDQVELTGLIPRDKVYESLVNADIFISASRGEGLPVAVLEAMACRCPVILSDIPPHREIADGVDFIPLICPDDVIGCAREIEKLQKLSVHERAEIGRKGRMLVEERFSVNKMHQRYQEIYTQVLKKHLIR